MMFRKTNRFSSMTICMVLFLLIIIVRLFYIQVIDSTYTISASNNALRHQVQFPLRGEVYDRKGEFIVQSKESYDFMVIPKDVEPFDTIKLATVLEVDTEQLVKEFGKAKKYSRRRPSVLFKQLPKEVKLRLDEMHLPGFYTVYRTVRTYPRGIAGNLLGYVGEVNNNMLAKDKYYRSGDYIGWSGIEQAYEKVLRGTKGVKIEMVDVFGLPQGSYANGKYDTMSIPGKAVISTLDANLQELAEELMQGKIGSCVAIEPSTGEILVMANSPTYDPNLLIGRERGNNYAKMSQDQTRPLFNRAVMASYPPGSTFKIVNGLIGLQEGSANYTDLHSCAGGYTIGRGVKCHIHGSPLNMVDATQTSCNAYFCYVFRDIIDNRKYKNIQEGFDVWHDYVQSFGFGRKLGSDFTGELNGQVPTAAYYDKKYQNRWNSLTVVSLSIGQGELGTTPLQLANLSAIMANRGYYYIPHVVKEVEGEKMDPKFKEKHYTKVETKHFDPIVEGMYKAVNVPGGTGSIAKLPGIEVCGKTGTAQNPQGADHSVFICFAPRVNPKIAVAVFIEHGRFGATNAAPIASLIVEKYLTDTITRQYLVDYIKAKTINYPMYK